MNFRTVFAVHQPVTSSTKCILQFWQRFSRTLEKSAGTSFAWLHEFLCRHGLTCKMYGRVLKIDFVPVFNTIPRARICMNFQTVFADTQLVVSSTRCIRSWVRCTVLQKKNLNYSNTGLIFKFTHSFAHTAINQPCIEKSDDSENSENSEFFMRACMRSGNLKQIYSLLTSLLKPQWAKPMTTTSRLPAPLAKNTTVPCI